MAKTLHGIGPSREGSLHALLSATRVTGSGVWLRMCRVPDWYGCRGAEAGEYWEAVARGLVWGVMIDWFRGAR